MFVDEHVVGRGRRLRRDFEKQGGVMMCRRRIRDTEPPIERLASAHARTRQVPVTPKICRVPEHAVRLEKAFELRIVDERLALEAVDASRIFGTQPFTQYGKIGRAHVWTTVTNAHL